MLRINFFSVWLPDDELPFLVRGRTNGELLRSAEREWLDVPQSPSAGEEPQELDQNVSRRAAVAVGPFDDEFIEGGYEIRRRPLRDVRPGIVKALTSEGLKNAFATRGLRVEQDVLGFSCLDPGLVPKSPLPEVISIQRGLRFRADHVVSRGRRAYGFFVSPTTQLHFVRTLVDDTELVKAALGERVSAVIEGRSRSAELRAADVHTKSASVVVDSETYEVALEHVRPRPTPRTIGRYFAGSGRTGEARAVRLAPQIANYRLLPNGQRNRRWLTDQYEFVCSWLLSNSDSGRIRFRWPKSEVELYMNTDALKISQGIS